MGSTAMLAGTVISAGSKIYGGMRQKASDDYAAAQLGQEAGQSVASGIQGSIEQTRRGNYVASNARARIAAGGLTTTGTSALAVTGNIQGEAAYRSLTQLYQGEDRAQELGYRADMFRNEGDAAETAGWIGGISSVLTGGNSYMTMRQSQDEETRSFRSKYAYDGPPYDGPP